MKILTKNLYFISTLILLFSSSALAQSWSVPSDLAGVAVRGKSAFPDMNGYLQFITQTVNSANPNAQRPHSQFLKNDDTVTAAVPYPLFPTNDQFFNQKGEPHDIIYDLNGNRIITWFALNNSLLAMTWQSSNGTYGPNIVNVGLNPSAIAFRNNLVIVFSVGTNGSVLIKEWEVGQDGKLNARPLIPELIDAQFGGCGATVAIESDNSAVAVFQLSDNIGGQILSQVRSAHRTASGQWSLGSTPIDSVNTNTQSMGCVYGASSPGGRLLAAWWKRGVGGPPGPSGANVDLGGEIRAILKEPGASLPNSTIPFHTATLDLNSGNKRRDYGISVAMGLDGTAGMIAYTEKCNATGPGESVFFSSGLLRIAGPSQDFYNVNNIGLAAMDSGANEVFGMSTNHTPVFAFAVENKRAIIASSTAAYNNIGTHLRPTCGPGQQVFDATLLTGKVTIYDGHKNQIGVQELGTVIRQTGQADIPGTLPYMDYVDAAVDFNGNFALVRGGTSKIANYMVSGDWQAGDSNNPQPTPTSGPNPTATPENPADTFKDNVKNQVAKAIILLSTAKKKIPTGKSAKQKAKKLEITNARKELNGIIAILIGLLKTEPANISANFTNFTDKNLNAVKAGIKAGTSKKLTTKQQSAGWKNANTLLSKLTQ